MATIKKSAAKSVKKPEAKQAKQASENPQKAEKSEAAPVELSAGDFHGRGHQ